MARTPVSKSPQHAHTQRPGMPPPELTKERLPASRPSSSPGLPDPIEPTPATMLATGSAAMFYGLRSSMHPDAFQQQEGHAWPLAPIDEGDAKGFVEMKPPGSAILPADELESIAIQMHRQTKELSQLDADTIEALCILWMRNAKHPRDWVRVPIDAIPELRGLLPKKSGSGRRGGYESEQRQEHADSLRRVSHLHMHMHELALYRDNGGKKKSTRREVSRGVEGPAFHINLMGQSRLDGGLDVDAIEFLPGAASLLYLWGPGRQTAVIDAKILRYDPYRQEPEKLLGRYLSWLWKIRSTKGTYSKPYRVSTLLKESRLQLNTSEPRRTRERLEKALDALQRDGVIRSWRYESWSLADAPRVGWTEPWLHELVIIEPPASVVSYYMEHLRGALPDGETAPLADRLRATRGRLELTQEQAAEAVGVSQQAYSRAERGHNVAAKNRGKLEAWLQQNAPNDVETR